MNKHEFNVTNLIADAFKERCSKFDVVSYNETKHLQAVLQIDKSKFIL